MTNTSMLVEQMCESILSDTDIKAIVKSRGFSPAENSSRASFANAFRSTIGLDAAFSSLSAEEIACLHLLSLEPKLVDIRFFGCLFKEDKGNWRPTFTKRFTPVLKAVQNTFVRKGVLVVSQKKPGNWEKTTKMERWRFYLPPEFACRLPLPFSGIKRFSEGESVNGGALRKKVIGIGAGDVREGPDSFDFSLRDGRLCIGDQLFSLSRLSEWQRQEWNREVRSATLKRVPPKEAGHQAGTAKPVVKDFTGLLNKVLSRLAPDEWIDHEALGPLLRVFDKRASSLDTKMICDRGWRLGCLARYQHEGVLYYRPVVPGTEAEPPPEEYLRIGDDQLLLDLQSVPYRVLELIAMISTLSLSGSMLKAAPDPIELGRVAEAIWQDPVTQWVRTNAVHFGKAMERIEVRRGKLIVHDHLLLARVKDLSLRVQIEKALPDPGRLVSLPNGFIAFPVGALTDIQKLISRSGHVIKTVEPT